MQLFHLKSRALLFILLKLLDYHGFPGPKRDLALLNKRKRCRLIAKQIFISILNPKIIGTPACKLCLDAVLQAGRDSLVKQPFKTDV